MVVLLANRPTLVFGSIHKDTVHGTTCPRSQFSELSQMGLEPMTLQDIYSTCAPPTSTRTAKLVRWVLAHTTVTVFPSLVTSTVLRPSVDHLTSSDNLFRNSTLNGNAVEPLNNGHIGMDHRERLSSFEGKMYCHCVVFFASERVLNSECPYQSHNYDIDNLSEPCMHVAAHEKSQNEHSTSSASISSSSA